VSSEADDFLKAIRERPDDIGLRLIYADWLEERGNPQGEFIRVQCGLAKECESQAQVTAWKARQHTLLAQHEANWTRHWHGMALGHGFRCGFLEEILISAQDFLSAKVADLLQRDPIRVIRLCEVRDLLAAVVASPRLSCISTLDLASNDLGDLDAEILVNSPHLGKLKELDLTANNLGDRGVRALAGARTLTGLTTLILDANPFGDPGAQALARSRYLDGLENLDLGGTQISDFVIKALRARFGDRVQIWQV